MFSHSNYQEILCARKLYLIERCIDMRILQDVSVFDLVFR